MTCAAETQGPYRLYRGQHYLAYLRQRHPDLSQPAEVVPGVGPEGDRMLSSGCGLAALFDDPAGQAACDKP